MYSVLSQEEPPHGSRFNVYSIPFFTITILIIDFGVVILNNVKWIGWDKDRCVPRVPGIE